MPFAFLLVMPVAAQWEFFPLGQKTYYSDLSSTIGEVDLVFMDTLTTDGDGTMSWHNKMRYRQEFLGTCGEKGLEYILQSIWIWNWNMACVMDSLVLRNDTLFFTSYQHDAPFFFLVNTVPGDTWTIPGTLRGDVVVTCDSLIEESLLGLTDSVKTFTIHLEDPSDPFHDRQFRLSKHHGLLLFTPFMYFVSDQASGVKNYQVIGWEHDGTVVGYRQPAFEEYYQWNAGDIMLWKLDLDPGWIEQGPPTTEYFRDSITQVQWWGTDSMKYDFDRTHLHADGSVTWHPGSTQARRNTDDSRLWAAAPYDLIQPQDPWADVWLTDPLRVTPTTDGTDTVTGFGAYTGGHTLGEECILYEGVDFGLSVSYRTGIGLYKSTSWLNPSTSSLELIAYRLGEETSGDINMGVPDQEAGLQGLTVYPNPVSDRLFLEGPWQAGTRYDIIDVHGRTELRGSLQPGGIGVQGLSPGLHVLLVETAQGRSAVRFVKE